MIPPGLLRRCPLPVGPHGRPERCLDSAAPEPPAHYMSYSQILQRHEVVKIGENDVWVEKL